MSAFVVKGLNPEKVRNVFGYFNSHNVTLESDEDQEPPNSKDQGKPAPFTDEQDQAIHPPRHITITRHDLTTTPLTGDSENRRLAGLVIHAASAGLVKLGRVTGKRRTQFFDDSHEYL